MRPIVGITTYVESARWGPWDMPAALVPLTYVNAVSAAGGRAVLIPPSDEGVDETLDAVDGVVFSGGADIAPDVYGAPRHPETTGLRPDRDRSETALLEAAVDRGIPVLAVCRGMQILNVVRGGDLIQHLPEVTGDASHREDLGVFSRHSVSIDPASKLKTILGERTFVASHHHQGPNRIGRGLRVSARAPDGTIEAIEDPERDFVVGVLWHPEEGEDRLLFEALVDRAKTYREERE